VGYCKRYYLIYSYQTWYIRAIAGILFLGMLFLKTVEWGFFMGCDPTKNPISGNFNHSRCIISLTSWQSERPFRNGPSWGSNCKPEEAV
jgi:hypothetical protein